MEKLPEGRLKGKVNSYSDSVKSGVVFAEDRQMYLFAHKEWLSKIPPSANLEVSFITVRNWAKSIMLLDEQEI